MFMRKLEKIVVQGKAFVIALQGHSYFDFCKMLFRNKIVYKTKMGDFQFPILFVYYNTSTAPQDKKK